MEKSTGRTPPASTDGAHWRREGGARRQKAKSKSDRDLERLGDLFLDRFGGFGHRFLRQGADVLCLSGHGSEPLSREFALSCRQCRKLLESARRRHVTTH